MIPRYNNIVEIAVLIPKKINGDKTYNTDAFKAFCEKLFPPHEWKKSLLISNFYGESHQFTLNIIGSFNMTTAQVMASDSELEALYNHFIPIINEEFKDLKYKYQIYTLDTKAAAGDYTV